MSLPKDPIMLLSAVNMKLRDYYGSLDELCVVEGMEKEDLLKKLNSVGFDYIPEINQFR